MPICQFCNANMSTISSLNIHQKKTKKCLIIQGIVPKGEFECPTCTLTFLSKLSLSSHTIACNKKQLPEIIANLETKYNTLEIKYNILETKYNMILEEKEKLLDKITTAALSKTNTNTNKNTVNITTYTRTDEELKHIYEDNLNSSHIEGGLFAITKLIVDKVITDDNGKKMITITDKIRGTAKYKLSNGENVIDNGLNTFTCKNRDIIMKKIYSIVVSNQEIANKILDEETNISKGYNEISDDLDGSNLRNSLIKSIIL